ncbi:hypothetical protein PGTUg99_024290 [Puccinia graminis f. sp. tritici]|uniref:Uncharacterized protein n=1 Tax=Puccinia graminis f. sp. tritici TaxID=56615 RepID=A0A5B0MDD3_PUCGR|nr:hypothetical protein PGTUg99_024290 [Puccinia graminis f. sp. tritici]
MQGYVSCHMVLQLDWAELGLGRPGLGLRSDQLMMRDYVIGLQPGPPLRPSDTALERYHYHSVQRKLFHASANSSQQQQQQQQTHLRTVNKN